MPHLGLGVEVVALDVERLDHLRGLKPVGISNMKAQNVEALTFPILSLAVETPMKLLGVPPGVD
jgi:hypothetical protein